jgi:CheY-like chemotaxis protein
MNLRAKHTVLVVEDEWLLRMELVDELGAAGWTIHEAGSGEEALLVLEQQAGIDFLVSDIRLGGKVDGWGVAERFRELHPDGPVVYVSANPDLANRRVPGSVFLGKPVMIETLLKTCDQFMLKH